MGLGLSFNAVIELYECGASACPRNSLEIIEIGLLENTLTECHGEFSYFSCKTSIPGVFGQIPSGVDWQQMVDVIPFESLHPGIELAVSERALFGIVVSEVNPEPARVIIRGYAHVLPPIGVVSTVMLNVESTEVQVFTVRIQPEIESSVTKI